MGALNAAGRILGIALVMLVYGVLGALSLAVTAFIIGGGALVLGFTGMGTAQAIAIWIMTIGAIGGALVGFLQALAV